MYLLSFKKCTIVHIYDSTLQKVAKLGILSTFFGTLVVFASHGLKLSEVNHTSDTWKKPRHHTKSLESNMKESFARWMLDSVRTINKLPFPVKN